MLLSREKHYRQLLEPVSGERQMIKRERKGVIGRGEGKGESGMQDLGSRAFKR
jgi:hypothetical protein